MTDMAVIPGHISNLDFIDPLAAALSRLVKEFDGPGLGRALSALPCDEAGYILADQMENAVDLARLKYRAIPGGKLPKKSHEFPALVGLRNGDRVIIYERQRGEVLTWTSANDEPVWTNIEELESQIVGKALHIFPDSDRLNNENSASANSSKNNWFWSEIKAVQHEFKPVLMAALLINLLAFAMPLFTMNVYDRIIPNRAAYSLWVLAIGVFLAFGIEFALKIARANLLDDVGRKLDIKLSEKIFAKLVNLPLSERDGDTGKFARRVSEFEMVRDFFASTTILLIVDLVFLILFVAMIAFLAGWLAMVPLVIILIMSIAGLILQRKMTAASSEAQIDSGLQHSLLVEAIGGAETLKACNAEARMVSRWRNLARISAQTQEQLRKLSSVAVNMASLSQQLMTISLIIGGFYLFDAGKITMGAIIAIIMLAGRSLAPAGQIAFLLTRGRQAITILGSLSSLMEAGDERRFGSKNVVPQVRDGKIRLDDVSFVYPGATRDALSDINVSINPGEKIAIIGRVASGKSTLGRLMCGLYYPTKGSVMVDGLDNQQYRPTELRSQLHFAGQDAELFSGSIKDNLLMGAPNADDSTLIAALARVGADEFLGTDAGGFDRGTGERGRKLSGGQRGFLVLARALASPSKLLFLDEPTGAMDMRTERAFIEQLSSALYPGQTLIVSTHRHSVISICDRLIIMDQGRIIADGPRDEIMAAAAEKGAA